MQRFEVGEQGVDFDLTEFFWILAGFQIKSWCGESSDKRMEQCIDHQLVEAGQMTQNFDLPGIMPMQNFFEVVEQQWASKPGGDLSKQFNNPTLGWKTQATENAVPFLCEQ